MSRTLEDWQGEATGEQVCVRKKRARDRAPDIIQIDLTRRGPCVVPWHGAHLRVETLASGVGGLSWEWVRRSEHAFSHAPRQSPPWRPDARRDFILHPPGPRPRRGPWRALFNTQQRQHGSWSTEGLFSEPDRRMLGWLPTATRIQSDPRSVR
jgi:hypothetical protein